MTCILQKQYQGQAGAIIACLVNEKSCTDTTFAFCNANCELAPVYRASWNEVQNEDSHR
jgi:hypothetical protein